MSNRHERRMTREVRELAKQVAGLRAALEYLSSPLSYGIQVNHTGLSGIPRGASPHFGNNQQNNYNWPPGNQQ